MKIAWIILIISVLTDGLLAFQTAVMTSMIESETAKVGWAAIGMAFIGAVALMLRTVQSELKAVGIKLSDLLREAIKQAGGTVPPTPPAASLLAVLLLAATLTGCTTLIDLGAIKPDDVQRGVEIAEQAKDPAGVACGKAILAYLAAKAEHVALDPVGEFSTFMTVRTKRRALEAPPDETLSNACAPLRQDAEATILRIGSMFAPGGGAIGGLLRR